jgi:hypothetical protein
MGMHIALADTAKIITVRLVLQANSRGGFCAVRLMAAEQTK